MEYFIINTAVASIYKDASHQSEMVTQALFGETCKIIDQKNDWLFIKQWDGYEFQILYKGSRISVSVDESIELQLVEGESIDLEVYDRKYTLNSTLTLALQEAE